MSTFKRASRGLTELGRDIVTIEVNTLASTGISGHKMPWYPHALLDIAVTYVKWFELIRGIDLSYMFDIGLRRVEARIEPFEHSRRTDLTNGWSTFDRLRRIAAKVVMEEMEAARQEDRETDLRRLEIARRIQRNCDQLKAMIGYTRRQPEWTQFLVAQPVSNRKELEPDRTTSDTDERYRDVDIGLTRGDLITRVHDSKGDPPRLSGEEAARLRKIWEIGTDQIVAQTIIHMDGDVVTRFNREGEMADFSRMLEVHKSGIDVSLSHWRTMLEVLERLIDGLAGKMFGTR